MTCFQAKDCDVPNTLNLYLREIKDGPLLSAAEERELAAAIAQGDRDARARMIKANLRLVVKIARDYLGRGMVLDDLIGGNGRRIAGDRRGDPVEGPSYVDRHIVLAASLQFGIAAADVALDGDVEVRIDAEGVLESDRSANNPIVNWLGIWAKSC